MTFHEMLREDLRVLAEAAQAAYEKSDGTFPPREIRAELAKIKVRLDNARTALMDLT